MADWAHEETDRILHGLERKIASVYGDAAQDIQKTIDDYFKKFAGRDAAQKARLEAGEITDAEYTEWRLAQMGRGQRYEAMRDQVALRMIDASKVANAYVNDTTPTIYSLNRNFAAYTIEKAGANVSFTLFDEQTVKRLIKDNPRLMPNYPVGKILENKYNMRYGQMQINKSVTSGILQGKSIPKIAKDLRERLYGEDKAGARRTARTAVTSAQNGGRMDTFEAAKAMGIDIKKEWIATLDNRTRHSHAALDGDVVDTDKEFANGCMFPGDPSGEPSEIYNCRCTMGASLPDFAGEKGQRRARDDDGKNILIEDMTYSQWEKMKSSEYTSQINITSDKKASTTTSPPVKVQYTVKQIDSMSRTQLVEVSRDIFIRDSMSDGLTKEEAERRFNALISSNSNSNLRKYIKKHR